MIKIKIVPDTDPQSPREWGGSLGTMCCWHNRYNLGDENGPDKLRADIRSSKHYRESWEDYDSDSYRDLSDPKQLIETAV